MLKMSFSWMLHTGRSSPMLRMHRHVEPTIVSACEKITKKLCVCVCVCVCPVFGGKTYLKERSNKNFSCAFRAAVSLIQN